MKLQQILESFSEKSTKLFTQGGLAVLLEYPPHGMVLDKQSVKDFIISTYKSIIEGERTRIAEIVAGAGENKISLLDNSDNFTGTYWISANGLYFMLTGKHLNQAFEDGDIAQNKQFNQLFTR